MDVLKIEEKLDKAAIAGTEISMSLGGVQFKTMAELFEMAKLMAISGLAVPPHLRGNPGACLFVCTKALRFGFDPFSLAEHSYRMVKREKQGNEWIEIETMAFDSFVIRAIIDAHAPILGRIKYGYDGEGDERTCTASVVERVTGEVLSHTSPTLGALKKMRGRNDSGKIKGSPLWDSPKSDQQQSYDTGRDLCRRYFPEILLGWYDKDELEEYGPHTAKDVTPTKPNIGERLKGQNGRGFNAEHVERETAGAQAQQQPALAAPTEQPITITADAAGKPKDEERISQAARETAEAKKNEAEQEKPEQAQQPPLAGNDPGPIPENLKRGKGKEPKAEKAKTEENKPAEPPKADPVPETVDEEAVMKTLLDTLHNAKQASVLSYEKGEGDDGLNIQRWMKSAATIALRAKLSKENDGKIGDAVREAWDVILK